LHRTWFSSSRWGGLSILALDGKSSLSRLQMGKALYVGFG
jgi:hypothetical protein